MNDKTGVINNLITEDGQEISDISGDLKTLKAEIDALQIQLGKDDGPWYLKPSLIISIFALSISIITTAVSEFRTHDEDVRANRRDVRTIIQRLTKLPIENFELINKHKDNPTGQALTSLINQENVLLAAQAAELIERHPNSFTSPEYYAVANALANSNIFGRVPTMYQRAIDNATNATDLVSSARGYGAFLYNQGAHSEGRSKFQEAIDVWKKFPERNPVIVNYFDFQTYLFWGQTAFGAAQVAEAREYVRKAEELLARFPASPFTQQLQGQLDATNAVISK